MPSTYSSLKIELIGTGDQAGTWGNTTNTNLGTAIEEAITGSANVTFANSNVALTLADTNASQTARNLRLFLTGTVSQAQHLFLPAIEKQYIIDNGLTFPITVANGSNAGATGATITVPAGLSAIIFNDGVNMDNPVSYTPLLGNVTINGGTVNGVTQSNVTIISGSANGVTVSNSTLVSSQINAYTEGITNGYVNTGAAYTINIADTTIITANLSASCTFTMPPATAGKSFILFLRTGAGSFTGTFTGVKFVGNTAPTITATANRMDILTFSADGTNWYGNYAQGFVP